MEVHHLAAIAPGKVLLNPPRRRSASSGVDSARSFPPIFDDVIACHAASDGKDFDVGDPHHPEFLKILLPIAKEPSAQ